MHILGPMGTTVAYSVLAQLVKARDAGSRIFVFDDD